MPEIFDKNSDPGFDFKAGSLLLIDKPIGWTSFDVVNKLKRIFKAKTGHAGTLDPLASGLLILATGRWTKRLNELQGLDKEYTGEIKLGVTTASYDAESPEENPNDFSNIDADLINKTASTFLGEQEQLPPAFSAIKVGGERLYKLARKGKPTIRPPRLIRIDRFDIDGIELPKIFFTVACAKGTYIRSLAHDLGQRLGVGAYLSSLRRTAIGNYRIEEAWQMPELIDHIQSKTSSSQ